MLLPLRLFFIFIVAFSQNIQATDKAREQRWVDQTVDAIFDGEPVFLSVPDHSFYSIYTEPDTESVNGIIVLHGTGYHPDYEKVVQPLRIALAQDGWHTLSIQLPLLASDAEYNDYVEVYPEVPPRLIAATEYLKQKGATNIGIVAHSQGATMACYYLAQTNNDIAALVAIGMSAQHTDKNINSAESLRKISIPVLDIFGSKDFPSVLETVDIRSQAASHNSLYKQQEIEGAYHFFDIREDELIDAVSKWLHPYKS